MLAKTQRTSQILEEKQRLIEEYDAELGKSIQDVGNCTELIEQLKSKLVAQKDELSYSRQI